PVFRQAASNPKRLVFPDGHHARILKAAEVCVDQGIAQPILLGAKDRITALAEEYDVDISGIEIIQPWSHEWMEQFVRHLTEIRARKGVTRDVAAKLMKRRAYFGVMMVQMGYADGFVGGINKAYAEIIRPALEICGTRKGVKRASGAYMVIRGHDLKFFSDTTVNIDPDAETLAEIAITTADLARSFIEQPRVAMLSFSNFGTTRHPSCRRVADAVRLVKERRPDIHIEGEMQVDIALNADLRSGLYPFAELEGEANVLIFPDLSAGNIAYKLMGRVGGADLIGPILLGIDKPINVLERDTGLQSIV
ncbi:MAG: NADP-dependent malic enzyme, partial [Myxococcales bacterium]|nr:NADP-dependent malic enzyme [Myxococcales bacterium]